MSRPAWGAWIETVSFDCKAFGFVSRPAWGAWIETVMDSYLSYCEGRAPHGARGLKQYQLDKSLNSYLV